ncbi:homoserine kinase [Jeotgalibacillus malaysiensis]|uniref:Homoserine kinase n=1 Tax=Jeotgalibacillus malaysiensis TaxID=1508404 RepID=A0A0B5AR65_9BACL|nr:homoserine kinase [Jeotgalibacillus malaysiensis]AJD91147.1 homoserine kinase [Jeotgalibacillus malaysiensis]
MSFSPFIVKTPASTANLGPGFDSIGLALPIYQTIAAAPAEKLSISYSQYDYHHLPTDESNLILKTIRQISVKSGKVCPGAELTVRSEIPLSKGLGSSAAAIAAGIVIADRLMKLELSLDHQIRLASEIEGHPDNVSASLAGGLTVSRFDDEGLSSVSLPAKGFSVIIMAPDSELETKESRGVLPANLTHGDAVLASAAANVMVAALITGEFQKAGQVMMKDTFHEPYRRTFFPNLDDIKKFACENGAFAVTISGAGPCISIFAEDAKVSAVYNLIKNKYAGYQAIKLKPSNQGTLCTEHHLNRLSV